MFQKEQLQLSPAQVLEFQNFVYDTGVVSVYLTGMLHEQSNLRTRTHVCTHAQINAHTNTRRDLLSPLNLAEGSHKFLLDCNLEPHKHQARRYARTAHVLDTG